MPIKSYFFSKYLFVNILLFSIPFCLNGQEQGYLDSLKFTLNQDIPDTMRIRLCMYLADNLPENEWFPYNQKAHQLASQLIQDLEGKELEKIQIFLAAAESNYGYQYENQGDILKALEHYYKALEIYDNLNYAKGQGQVYSNLGVLYNEQGDFKEALDFLEKSLKIREKYDRSDISKTYMSIGFTHNSLGNKQEAISFLKKGLTTAKENNLESDIAIALNNIGAFYFLNGEEEKAIPFYKQAIQKSIEIENEIDAAWIMNNLTSYYLQKNKLDSAEYYGNQSLQIADSYDLLILKESVYENMTNLRKQQNRWKEAFNFQSQTQVFKDSLNNINGQKTALKKKLEYDHELEKTKIELSHHMDQIRAKSQRTYLIVGIIFVLILFIIYYRNYLQKKKDNILITEERDRSNQLLLNILPVSIAKELKEQGFAEPRLFESVTILFTDFVGFTQFSEQLSPKELVEEIDFCYKAFDQIIEEHQIEKIKTIGDSYMCVAGLPEEHPNHAIVMVKAAIAIKAFMQNYFEERAKLGKKAFTIRIGIHSGSVIAGVVGKRKFAYDIWGDAVNIASRMESSGEPGKINISQSTYELINHSFKCSNRGKIEAKNKGLVKMYFVENEKIMVN